MPIVIPSKKIYSIDTPILLNNKISKLSVPVLSGKRIAEETTLATLESFEKSPREKYLSAGTHYKEDLYIYNSDDDYYDNYDSDNYGNVVAIRGFFVDFKGEFERDINVDYGLTSTLSYDRKATKYTRKVYQTTFDSSHLPSGATIPVLKSFYVDARGDDGEAVSNSDIPSRVSIEWQIFEEVVADIIVPSLPTTISTISTDGKIIVEIPNIYVGCSVLKIYADATEQDVVEDYVPDSVTIEVFGNKYTFESTEISKTLQTNDSAGIEFIAEGSCFLRTSTSSAQQNTGYEDTLKEYSTGKTLATVICSVGEYKNTDNRVIISTKSDDKMLFDIGDEAFVMTRNEFGIDFPLNNKIYKVLGHNLYFDGAVWQKLTMQEIYEPPSEEFEYTLLPDGTYAISKFTATDWVERIILPSKYLDTPITQILGWVFEDKFIGSIVIPEGITNLTDNSFYRCLGIDTISLPNSVKSIGDYAFSGSFILGIELPDQLEELGMAAFANCKELLAIKIPKNIASISMGLATNCEKLSNIGFHKNITSIEQYAFQNCVSLKSLTFNFGLQNIGHGAFSLCTGLTEIHIPDSVNTIEGFAFYGCTKLKDIYYMGTEAQWNAINIGDRALPDGAIVHFSK